MKRVVLAVFLAVFAASVIGRSVERTASWAAQHASASQHSKPDRGGARMGEARKYTRWQGYVKLLQDGSLAVSFAQALEPHLAEAIFHQVLAAAVLDPSERSFSSRAPPALI